MLCFDIFVKNMKLNIVLLILLYNRYSLNFNMFQRTYVLIYVVLNVDKHWIFTFNESNY